MTRSERGKQTLNSAKDYARFTDRETTKFYAEAAG